MLQGGSEGEGSPAEGAAGGGNTASLDPAAGPAPAECSPRWQARQSQSPQNGISHEGCAPFAVMPHLLHVLQPGGI